MSDDYRGPAVVRVADEERAVEIRMWARFEPVEGRYRWAGRTAPDPFLRDRLGTALLILPGAPGRPVRLSEPDPWGGVRLSGAGKPPWSQ